MPNKPTHPASVEAIVDSVKANERAYRDAAPLGEHGIDAAISTTLVEILLAEKSPNDHSRGYAQGLKVALGRLLAIRDALPVEHHVSAFNRARDYLAEFLGEDTGS